MRHVDQLSIDTDVVRALIGRQFPQWENEPDSPVQTEGTVNAIYRIGSHLGARFPLRAVDPAEALVLLPVEAAAMTEFTGCCPFRSP